MATIEEEISELLRARAEQMPVDPQLFASVQARSHRIAVHQRIGAALAVAATVAVVTTVPTVLHANRRNSPGPGPANSAAPTVSASPAPTDHFLVKAPSVTATFPLTLTYLPPGVRRQAVLLRNEGLQTAIYADPRAKTGLPSGIQLDVSATMLQATGSVGPTVNGEPADGRALQNVSAISVQGRPGTLTVAKDGSSTAVTWLRKRGQWAQLQGWKRWSDRTMLMRVIAGLRDQEQTRPPDFKLALAPAGFVASWIEPQHVTLGLPGSQPSNVVDVAASQVGKQVGQPVTIGNRSGWLDTQSSTYFILTLRISASTYVTITAPQTAPWNVAQFRRFAAGVEYLGPQPPPPAKRY